MKSIIEEIQRLEKQLSLTLSKLSNESFLNKASKETVEKEYQKRQDFMANLIIANNQWNSQYKSLLYHFETRERIGWHIQYLRECLTKLPLYEKEWFDYVYCENISLIESEQLYNLIFKI